ncbi:MAG: ice-binding family protein [bacterium]
MKKIGTLKSIISLLFLFGLIGPMVTYAAGPATVDLQSAANYVILAKTGITTTPGVLNTSITGDLGVSPAFAGSATGFGLVMDTSNAFSTSALVSGKIYAADYSSSTASTLTTAVSAMEAAYTDAVTRVPGTGATNLNVGAGTLSGQNFVPGTYTWNGPTSNVTVTGDITLTGTASDIWIFQIAGTLDVSAGQKIILAGGAQPKNVFWTVAGAVTLVSGSQFQGNILAQTNIAMQDGAALNGRALAQTAVTLIGNSISISTSTTTTVRRSNMRRVTASPTPIIVPIVGLLKIPTPTSLTTGPGKVTFNYTVWNVAKLQPLRDITVIDDKCNPVILVSGDVNNNNVLDLDEKWNYSCTSLLTGTTTNTAMATAHSTDGYYNTAIATAVVTVPVGSSSVVPPIIHIVKVPSQLAPLPFGGGYITYSYNVTNPGTVAIKNVSITDDKCTDITPVSYDVNKNGLLDTNETWTYTCKTYVPFSTGSVATARGDANNLSTIAYSFVNVLVAVPSLPNTGLPAEIENATDWNTILLDIAVVLLGITLIIVLRKKSK